MWFLKLNYRRTIVGAVLCCCLIRMMISRRSKIMLREAQIGKIYYPEMRK
jgi:hypothetical protein